MSEETERGKAKRKTIKYQNDPVYRELQRKRTRLSYWRKRPIQERPSADVLHTDLKADIEVEGLGRQTVPIYRVGTVAKVLGISTQSVRIWEDRGILPDSGITIRSHDRPTRGYTYDQIRAMYDLMPLLNFPDSRDETPVQPNPKNKTKYPKGEKDYNYLKDRMTYKKEIAAHRYDHNPFSRELKRRWESFNNGIDLEQVTREA